MATPHPLRSFFRSFRRVTLLLTALAGAAYALLSPAAVTPDSAPGPAYDLLFGVRTAAPDRHPALALTPYVIDGILHVQAEPLPADEAPDGFGVTLYRYHHHTGRAEPLPLLSERERQHLTGRTVLVVEATKHLRLDARDTSPDGYALAAPNWVAAGPVRNVLGKLVLLLLSGKTATITERETAPRLTNQAGSRAIRSASPLLPDEADAAFLLGWVVPASPSQ